MAPRDTTEFHQHSAFHQSQQISHQIESSLNPPSLPLFCSNRKKNKHQPHSLLHIWLRKSCTAFGPPAADVDVHGRLVEQAEQAGGSPWRGVLLMFTEASRLNKVTWSSTVNIQGNEIIMFEIGQLICKRICVGNDYFSWSRQAEEKSCLCCDRRGVINYAQMWKVQCKYCTWSTSSESTDSKTL